MNDIGSSDADYGDSSAEEHGFRPVAETPDHTAKVRIRRSHSPELEPSSRRQNPRNTSRRNHHRPSGRRSEARPARGEPVRRGTSRHSVDDSDAFDALIAGILAASAVSFVYSAFSRGSNDSTRRDVSAHRPPSTPSVHPRHRSLLKSTGQHRVLFRCNGATGQLDIVQ